MSTSETGQQGEQIAADFLKNNGYVPVQLVQELKENKTDAN